jgi:hypothetical protein
MLTDQWQGYAGLPDFPDPATVPTHLKTLFDFLAARAVPRYASPAERDAELSSPEPGQMAWVASAQALYVFSSGAWQQFRTSPDPWHPLVYQNGWGGPGRYRLDQAGNVHVQARMTTVGTSGTTPSAAAFTLPPGYRHTLSTFMRLPAGTNQLSTQAAGYWYSTGEVSFSTNVQSTGYVSINETFSTL